MQVPSVQFQPLELTKASGERSEMSLGSWATSWAVSFLYHCFLLCSPGRCERVAILAWDERGPLQFPTFMGCQCCSITKGQGGWFKTVTLKESYPVGQIKWSGYMSRCCHSQLSALELQLAGYLDICVISLKLGSPFSYRTANCAPFNDPLRKTNCASLKCLISTCFLLLYSKGKIKSSHLTVRELNDKSFQKVPSIPSALKPLPGEYWHLRRN